MNIAQWARRSSIVVLAAVLALSLAGCATSQYIDAVNPMLATFSKAMDPVNAQIDKVNANNALLGDKAWQDEMKTALDALDKAGKAFASLPTPPDQFKEVDDLLKKTAFETSLLVDGWRTMIANQDISLAASVSAHSDNINALIGQMNTAIDKANK